MSTFWLLFTEQLKLFECMTEYVLCHTEKACVRGNITYIYEFAKPEISEVKDSSQLLTSLFSSEIKIFEALKIRTWCKVLEIIRERFARKVRCVFLVREGVGNKGTFLLRERVILF